LRYCGIFVGQSWQQLCSLEEQLVHEPPVRLRATFYEPGTVSQVAAQVRALGDVVVGIASPAGQGRLCDRELEHMGVPAQPFLEAGPQLFAALEDLGVFRPGEDERHDGTVPDSAFRTAAVFETNVDGAFAALQGRRVPARRHPFGMRLRIQELLDDHVTDEGGDLWNRRAEEIEAAAAALVAHRYAVGHACWLGDSEGAIVLPGSRVPERFSAEGVLPPAPRLPLAGG
jgi:hypothetical protein